LAKTRLAGFAFFDPSPRFVFWQVAFQYARKSLRIFGMHTNFVRGYAKNFRFLCVPKSFAFCATENSKKSYKPLVKRKSGLMVHKSNTSAFTDENSDNR